MVSECAPGPLAFTTSELEISSMRNWATAVNLWNLALDPQGGPVQPPNYGCLHCTGIVTVDPVRHTVHLTRDYYQLGQFSQNRRSMISYEVWAGSNTTSTASVWPVRPLHTSS